MSNISKQDRQGARTPADLERKYKFGQSFAEVMGIATDAQKAACVAAEGVEGLDEKLDQTEIFNRLTNNGQSQGIFRGEDGEIYINASFLVTGIIKSPDGTSLVIDLDNGMASLTGSLQTISQNEADGSAIYARVSPGNVYSRKQKGEIGAPDFVACSATMHGDNVELFATGGLLANMAVSPEDWKTEITLKGGTDIVGRTSNTLEMVSSPTGTYISGLSAPTEQTMAVNKEYVDALEARIAVLEAALGIS